MSRLPTHDILKNLDQINQELSQTSDQQKLIELGRKQKKLQIQADLAIKIESLEKSITENELLLAELSNSDDELAELTKEDNDQKKTELAEAEKELLSYLTPQDERDDMDILLEIRAGAGGDESSLFAAEMLRMYGYLGDKLGFKLKIVSSSENPLGGYKEVIMEIRGESVYSWFKYESGVHRVQRVPVTEKQGRVHTSTVSLAIMPLIEKDNSFKLDPKDIEIIVSTSSGHGGQSVNTTYSAIRMKHTPTGIEAQSQDERSQVQNREKALQVLTSRVCDFYEEERLAKESAERREQVGRADRSEKIRTYNFPQDRLTDHRYNTNWNQLPYIMDGNIYQVILEIKQMEAQNVLLELNKSLP
jgi:peptide chain release factor 1